MAQTQAGARSSEARIAGIAGIARIARIARLGPTRLARLGSADDGGADGTVEPTTDGAGQPTAAKARSANHAEPWR